MSGTTAEDIFHLGIKALLRDSGGKVLLLQVNPEKLHGERKDYWDLPGGRVQKGGSVIDTLKREVEEETGITEAQDPEEIGMVLSNIRIPLGEGESAGLILNIYACSIPAHSTIALSDEHVAYEWFAPPKAAELLQVKYPEEFCKLIAAL
jgi:8-oxo-dGTP pyrophosphatase MutT (NUDIX family)